MDLYTLDYISLTGRSWLHQLPAETKLVSLALFIALLLWAPLAFVPALGLLGVLLLAATARVPFRIFLTLLSYPVLFLAIILISVQQLTLAGFVLLATRVLAITGAVVLVFLTTSFPVIFGTLGRVLPSFLVAALFYTYRAIFVIAQSITDARTALHLRGGLNWRHPLTAIQHLGSALGHVVVHAIDASQRMGDSLQVRGFANRVYYLEDAHER